MSRYCFTKGNVNRKLGGAYFMPSHKASGKINIDNSLAERLFCSERAGEAKGS